MDDGQLHPAVARIVREHGAAEALEVLAARLPGADLTALLLHVARRRATAITAAQVLARYERDRFVQPAAVDARRLLALELLSLDTVVPPFDAVTTSPLAPLGTHAAVAGVHQDRVVSTVRGSEVAADPTASLALEAARRRRTLLGGDPRSDATVRLASVGRVVRAQRFEGPRSFAHFSLLGLVSAGRDTGDHEFEARSLPEHVRALVAVARRAGFARVAVRLTDFGGRHHDVVATVARALGGDGVDVSVWPDRQAARGYYPNLCFKVYVPCDGIEEEVGDGGLVGWTQTLVGSRKERLMTSGLSIERLAILGVPPVDG